MNTIPCPHCGKEVEISEAFKHQVEERVKKDSEKKFEADLEKARTDAYEKALLKAKEDSASTQKDTEKQLAEQKEESTNLRKELSKLLDKLSVLETKDSNREIELKKTLLIEREKIQIEVSKNEKEKADMDRRELQKQLDDTKKLLDDAQRKAEQKSQQMQGEVMELDLESQLITAFQNDEILPVPKGIEGGDVWQKVKNKLGQNAGSILWEIKRTKAWSNSWTSKLRENTRQTNASTSILVSTVLPENIRTFGLHENVWVTTFEYAIPLASVIRNGLLQLAIAKSGIANKDEKLEMLYSYLTDHAFRHRFEAQVESIIELKQDLEAEQRSTVRSWKKREMQVNRMRNNLAGLYGELQGILGQALPTLPVLEAETSIVAIDDPKASLLE